MKQVETYTSGETLRLTATERDGLLRLNMAYDILLTVPEKMNRRMKLIPGAKRDLAMMAKRMTKIMNGVCETIPDEQLTTYLNALRMASYTIGVKSPGAQVRDDVNYGAWYPWKVLNALLDGCHDHCMMCGLDIVGQKKCPLRKALDTIPSDVEDRDDGGCPYYTMI